MAIRSSDLSDLYSESNRARFLTVALLVGAAISFADWIIFPDIDLGFLFIFPILIAAGFLSRWQLVGVAILATTLREVFGPFSSEFGSIARMSRTITVFLSAGFFVRELARNRQAAMAHVKAIEEESRLRKDAEKELQVLVDRSPAAILTVDPRGKVLLANAAAHRMLACDNMELEGKPADLYLPALAHIQERSQTSEFQSTEMESTGRRQNGEIFQAHLWVSTYKVGAGPRLAAIVVDSSEELRDRAESSLYGLLLNSRILVGAVSHEIRNLCGAISVVHANLARRPGLTDTEDFRALGNLLEALRNLASAELRPLSETRRVGIPLGPLMEDLRIVIEPAFRESGSEVLWELPASLPPVWADRQSLFQVFLNLAQNAERAMNNGNGRARTLTIKCTLRPDAVIMLFADTGPGVSQPELLFRAFEQGSVVGLGLYVSRALMRSFGGDLRYESSARGACFALDLLRADQEVRSEDAGSP